MSDSADKATDQPKRTEAEQAQHSAVLDSASHNLDLVIDQITSLQSDQYEPVLDSLNQSREALNSVRGLQ